MVEENIAIQTIKWLVKWSAIIIGALVALVTILLGGAWSYNWYAYERPKSQIEIVVKSAAQWTKKDEERSDTSSYPCAGGEYPIFIGIVNRSSRTVEQARIDVSAHFEGHSTDILPWNSTAVVDWILTPGEGRGGCWRFPPSPEYAEDSRLPEAIYVGEVTSVEFE